MDLRQVQSDPVAFRDALLIDAVGSARRLSEVADGWQRDDFARLDNAWRTVAGISAEPCRLRAWLERGRGHSKTADIAAMATFALFAARRPIRGVAAAADQDQARLLADAVSRLVQLNSWLRMIEVQRDKIVNQVNGADLRILTSDAPTSYGLTPDFVVCDEVTHWAKRDLWDSLFSSAAKKASCLLLVIANAGFQQDWQWPLREAVRTDPDWIFSRQDGPVASWISLALLAEQRRLLPPAAYARLWLNQWSSGAGDALPEDAITKALTLVGPCESLADLGPGWLTVAGLDLGLRRDLSSLCIVGKSIGYTEEKPVARPHNRLIRALAEIGHDDFIENDDPPDGAIYHPGTGRIRLLEIRAWDASKGATVSLDAVERAVIRAHARWNLSAVAADVWQAAMLVEKLRTAGVPAATIDPTGSNLKEQASQLLTQFNEGHIDLFPDEGLLRDLRAARIVEKQYGFRIESPRDEHGHADRLSALLLGLLAARRLDYMAPTTVGGELLTYP